MSRRAAFLPGTSLRDPTYSRVLEELPRALRRLGWRAAAFCPRRDSPSELQRFRPHILNIHLSGHLSAAALRFIRKARAGGAGLALTFQDFRHPDLPRPSAAEDARLRELARGARAVTALTPELAAAVKKGLKLRATPSVVGNGVGRSWFAVKRRGGGGLVCVSRLAPYKGVDVLIWAFADLARERPEAALTVFGPDFQRGHHAALVKKLGLSGRVTLAGRASRRTLAAALARARLAVSAARRETYGMAVLEAMACGAPVLATRAGAVPRLIRHGRTGWLVPPGDARALSEALRRLWSEPGLEKAGAAGRQAARAHTWDRRAMGYDAVFRRALDGR